MVTRNGRPVRPALFDIFSQIANLAGYRLVNAEVVPLATEMEDLDLSLRAEEAMKIFGQELGLPDTPNKRQVLLSQVTYRRLTLLRSLYGMLLPEIPSRKWIAAEAIRQLWKVNKKALHMWFEAALETGKYDERAEGES